MTPSPHASPCWSDWRAAPDEEGAEPGHSIMSPRSNAGRDDIGSCTSITVASGPLGSGDR